MSHFDSLNPPLGYNFQGFLPQEVSLKVSFSVNYYIKDCRYPPSTPIFDVLWMCAFGARACLGVYLRILLICARCCVFVFVFTCAWWHVLALGDVCCGLFVAWTCCAPGVFVCLFIMCVMICMMCILCLGCVFVVYLLCKWYMCEVCMLCVMYVCGVCVVHVTCVWSVREVCLICLYWGVMAILS